MTPRKGISLTEKKKRNVRRQKEMKLDCRYVEIIISLLLFRTPTSMIHSYFQMVRVVTLYLYVHMCHIYSYDGTNIILDEEQISTYEYKYIRCMYR